MGKISEKINNAPAKKQPENLKDFVKVYKNEIAKALPKVLTPERFSRMVTTALTTTPKLHQCTPESFIGAMLQAAQLGLEPNTPLGQAYLIPYGSVCQFQVGYKGLINLAQRSGEIKNIEAHVVYENDEFKFEYGLNSNLKHIPAMTNRGEPVWVYAIYRLVNGGYCFEVMSYDECLNHGKKYSKTYKNGPWQTAPEEMAKKTMIKKVLKYAPLKSDFVSADEQSFEFNPDTSEFAQVNVFEDDENVIVDSETGEVVEN